VPEAEEDEPDEPEYEPNEDEPGPPALPVQLLNLHPAAPSTVDPNVPEAEEDEPDEDEDEPEELEEPAALSTAGPDAMPVYDPAIPDPFPGETKAAVNLLLELNFNYLNNNNITHTQRPVPVRLELKLTHYICSAHIPTPITVFTIAPSWLLLLCLCSRRRLTALRLRRRYPRSLRRRCGRAPP